MDTASYGPAWSPAPDLAAELAAIHALIRARHASIDRVAFALHDPDTDILKTFVSSNSDEVALRGYEVALHSVPSLLRLSRSATRRVVDDIDEAFPGTATHTAWLKARGYRSSYTTPVFDGQQFVGFLFYDSKEQAVFAPEVCEFLDGFSQIVAHLFLLQRKVVEGIIGTVQVAIGLAKVRDIETGAHLQRIAHYSKLVARALARGHDLSDEFVEYVMQFAPLHDIGKVGIPDHILRKPGRLDDEEWRVMRNHVDIGLSIIDQICDRAGLQDSLASRIMRNIVGAHHERGDGSGYPRRLREHEIPLEARIVAVADVYDALTHRRPYKPAWAAPDVEAEMRREAAAGRLDAQCVAALLAEPERLREISELYADPE